MNFLILTKNKFKLLMHVTDDHLLASVRISKCESNEFSQAWKYMYKNPDTWKRFRTYVISLYISHIKLSINKLKMAYSCNFSEIAIRI